MSSLLLRTGLPAIVLVAAVAACSSDNSSSSSSGGTSGTSGTSGGTSGTSGGTSGTSGGTSGSSGGDPKAQAIAVATFVLGSHTAAECPVAGQALKVGAFPSTFAVTQANDPSAGGQVIMNCRVVPDGAGFTADANVQIVNDAGNALLMNAEPDATGAATGGGMSVSFGGPTYSSSTCTFTGAGTSPSVGGGRYWSKVTCTDARNVSDSTKVCDLEAEVLIENCAVTN